MEGVVEARVPNYLASLRQFEEQDPESPQNRAQKDHSYSFAGISMVPLFSKIDSISFPICF